jgi:hypothetical protein
MSKMQAMLASQKRIAAEKAAKSAVEKKEKDKKPFLNVIVPVKKLS